MCYLEVGDKSVLIVGMESTADKDRSSVLSALRFDTQGKKPKGARKQEECL